MIKLKRLQVGVASVHPVWLAAWAIILPFLGGCGNPIGYKPGATLANNESIVLIRMPAGLFRTGRFMVVDPVAKKEFYITVADGNDDGWQFLHLPQGQYRVAKYEQGNRYWGLRMQFLVPRAGAVVYIGTLYRKVDPGLFEAGKFSLSVKGEIQEAKDFCQESSVGTSHEFIVDLMRGSND